MNKKESNNKYAKTEAGKKTRAKAWKKYSQKPEVKARRLELRRKLYKTKGQYFNKFCDLYQVCNKCKIEKSWLNFSVNTQSQISRNYYCRSCDSKRTSEYCKNNRNKINKARSKRLKNDKLFKIRINTSKRINEIFRKKFLTKKKGFNDYTGCSRKELFNHIESKFQPGMTWENYGEWEIDHIYPLSLAKSEEEIYKLANYNNLQPLWKFENRSKGNKIG